MHGVSEQYFKRNRSNLFILKSKIICYLQCIEDLDILNRLFYNEGNNFQRHMRSFCDPLNDDYKLQKQKS